MNRCEDGPPRTDAVVDDSARTRRYRTNLQSEVDRAFVYRAMAVVERDPELARALGRLADGEARHARFWLARLELVDAAPFDQRPSNRARALAWLARRFGSRLVLPTALSLERAEQDTYEQQPEAEGSKIAAEERAHLRVLEAALRRTSAGATASALGRVLGRRRAVTGNALRAAVLGANDGLVSNLSLVMGVAGADLSGRTILITGLAGLLAGAFSMAMGEWISVQSSRELHQRELELQADEIATDPEHEQAELASLYRRRGLPAEEARLVAVSVMRDEATALEAMAREELGFDPNELGGSPWTAAIASFVLFVAGAIIPVIPFAVAEGDLAVFVSIVLSGLALIGIGAAITLLTGRGAGRSALRQLAIGLGAAAVTYAAGFVVGSAV